ncbi:MAG: topoisomerase IV [Oscillospiraceae bacterium]|jgi:DNA gyrase subunit A|nr:topoisomerase IV [Oscillospiraceae bacterium]
MPRKKQPESGGGKKNSPNNPNVIGLRAEVIDQPIVDTLETNFMPYAMSVIVSRALPEIDGFKPSQRKLLYTMYKMGLSTGNRTKSSNIVGQTMRLNPHGELAIYDTLVRLSAGYEALLAPFVDSKGNFGKVYSRDMACAAARYTEARLSSICAELFRDIDRDTVDFIDNYDSTTTEPVLLPTTFPNILVSSNIGIAVGMACRICSFNLAEVCRAAIAYLRDPECDLLEIMPAPDFPTGGELIYDRGEMSAIYETGRGSFKVRSRWTYVKEENIIEVTEIPYSTTAEAIIDKIAELIRAGKLREVSDMRDETGLQGLKLAIDLKRGTDPDKLMAKLMKLTPLTDSFSCDFNILIAGSPRVMGVRKILSEWCAWRTEAVRRRIFSDMEKKKSKLHLLRGLVKILLDIDRAIKIIRETTEERDVVPNLMIAFGIDEAQADYIAEIKLRNINREYIIKRTDETASLENEIADLEDTLAKPARVRAIIIRELEDVVKKHGAPRKTGIVAASAEVFEEPEDSAPDYPVNVFLSREGYFKKITPQSLRMSAEQKYKESDGAFLSFESRNKNELLIFTDRCQCYKARLRDFEDTKASSLGAFLPSALGMDAGENIIFALDPADYAATLLIFFENGKAARVPLSAYATKTNRRRLTGAFSDKSPAVTFMSLAEEAEIALYSSDGRAMIFSSAQLSPKTTRGTQGVQALTLRRNTKLTGAKLLADTPIQNRARYLSRALPAAGAKLSDADSGIRQFELF